MHLALCISPRSTKNKYWHFRKCCYQRCFLWPCFTALTDQEHHQRFKWRKDLVVYQHTMFPSNGTPHGCQKMSMGPLKTDFPGYPACRLQTVDAPASWHLTLKYSLDNRSFRPYSLKNSWKLLVSIFTAHFHGLKAVRSSPSSTKWMHRNKLSTMVRVQANRRRWGKSMYGTAVERLVHTR